MAGGSSSDLGSAPCQGLAPGGSGAALSTSAANWFADLARAQGAWGARAGLEAAAPLINRPAMRASAANDEDGADDLTETVNPAVHRHVPQFWSAVVWGRARALLGHVPYYRRHGSQETEQSSPRANWARVHNGHRRNLA